MGLTAHEVRELADIAREQEVFLMEAMWMKFSPAFRDVLAIVASGRIGEVRSVQAAFGAPFPRGLGSRWSAELGGSALLDQASTPSYWREPCSAIPKASVPRAATTSLVWIRRSG